MTVPKQAAFLKTKHPKPTPSECTPPIDWHMHNNSVSPEGYKFKLSGPIKTTHSDLLAIVLLQLWFCSDYFLKIHPSASFIPPIILVLPYFFPFLQNDSVAPLKVLFSYKNRPPGFSSTTTVICPSVLGVTEVIQTVEFKVERTAQLQASESGLPGTPPCSLLNSCQEMVRSDASSVRFEQASPRHSRAGVVPTGQPASQPASHQEFFTSWTPVSPPPKKSLFFLLLGPGWPCGRVFSVLSLNRCE